MKSKKQKEIKGQGFGFIILYGFAADNSVRSCYAKTELDMDMKKAQLKEYGAYLICSFAAKKINIYSVYPHHP